jgi:threonine/homoserine/homoserine lactone efflux protein
MSFVPEFPLILQFAIAAVILAITPGPDMTLFVGRTLSEGTAAGFACMFGAMTGLLVHTILVSIGLSALIVASPKAFLALKLAGALYLAWLAFQAIRNGSAFSPEIARRAPRPLIQNWMTGIGIDLLNPKVVLFFVTFLPQFVSAGDANAPGKLMFFGCFLVLVSIIVTTPMILAASHFTALMRSSRRMTRIIDWTFAGVFFAFAVRILTAETE